MNIFALIDSDRNMSISDEISSELSFLEETDESYDEYMSISNECAMTSALLYETISTESIGDTFKAGLDYMMKLIRKIIIMLGNGMRRLLKFLNINKGALIIKRLDEENNEIEVNHPEVVKESEEFWRNVKFDDIDEAEIISVETNIQDDLIVKLKNTFLYRILLISRIIQPNSDYTSLVNIKGVDENLKNIINKLNSKRAKTIANYSNLFDLIREEVDELIQLNKKLLTSTDSINMDNEYIKDFANKHTLNDSLGVDIEKVANFFKQKENLEKNDTFISAIEIETSKSYSKRYISNTYVKVILSMMMSLNKYINKGTIKSLFTDIANLNNDNKRNVGNSINNINKEKSSDNSRKPLLDKLNKYYTFILNINVIINAINAQIPKMLATAKRAK
jgi:hypothetical protein